MLLNSYKTLAKLRAWKNTIPSGGVSAATRHHVAGEIPGQVATNPTSLPELHKPSRNPSKLRKPMCLDLFFFVQKKEETAHRDFGHHSAAWSRRSTRIHGNYCNKLHGAPGLSLPKLVFSEHFLNKIGTELLLSL